MLKIEPFPVADVEEKWNAWITRCRVSHYPHYVPYRNARAAFYVPTKPLSEVRIALLSSGGVNLKTDTPFDIADPTGDDSVRWIPADVDVSELCFQHDHYDHTDTEKDPNCMFPIERLQELEGDGIVGSTAAQHVGFMGWIPNPDRFARQTAPEVVALLQEDRVDAAVLSPG